MKKKKKRKISFQSRAALIYFCWATIVSVFSWTINVVFSLDGFSRPPHAGAGSQHLDGKKEPRTNGQLIWSLIEEELDDDKAVEKEQGCNVHSRAI